MEQTNLVVTPDGQTWDEVTRDVNYIGNGVVSCSYDDVINTSGAGVPWDDWRGGWNDRDFFNKDFAIAYDRIICLVNGYYNFHWQTYVSSSGAGKHCTLKVNGSIVINSYMGAPAQTGPLNGEGSCYLSRGDYVQITDFWNDPNDNNNYCGFWIERF